MANPRRAATIMASVATIQADQGPSIEHYAMPLGHPSLYRFVVGSTDTDDALNILAPSGGTVGRWVRQREDIKGANLTDAAASIAIAGNRWRVLPAATLSANRVATFSTTGAVAGDVIRITRLDVGAWTYALVNGGIGAGTMFTLPASQKWWADCYFDGTNWQPMAAGQMP